MSETINLSASDWDAVRDYFDMRAEDDDLCGAIIEVIENEVNFYSKEIQPVELLDHEAVVVRTACLDLGIELNAE
jgi:hypothetical protein